MKHLIAIILLLSPVALLAQEEIRNVDTFEEISVFGPFDITFIIGSPQIIIEKADIDTERIITKVEDGVLKIKVADAVYKDVDVDLVISSNSLKRLKMDAGGYFSSREVLEEGKMDLHVSKGAEVDIEVKTTKMVVKVQNGGQLEISGSTGLLEVDAFTGGYFEGKYLAAEDAYLKSNTGGQIESRCLNNIEATASTGGTIVYWGQPKVQKSRTSLGGTITKK